MVMNSNISLFVESLQILKESNREINSLLFESYKDQLCSSNSPILLEQSLGRTVETVISVFINVIVSITNRFKKMIEKLFFSNKAINKYESKLRSLKHEFNVDFERYNYTCYDSTIPRINLKVEFIDQYYDLIDKLDNISGANISTQERSERLRIMSSEIETNKSNPYYDFVRARSIGKSGGINAVDFPQYLFNIYRDGGKPISTKVTPTDVAVTFDRWCNAKRIIKEVDKLKSDTIKSAKDIQCLIVTLSPYAKKKEYRYYNEENIQLLIKVLDKKLGQVNLTCNIFTLAFSAKLDALKESAIQDYKVLSAALRFINSGLDNV